MIFNSFDFAIFLPIVFSLYWCLGSRRVKAQNILLVAASYFFYGTWDWRFLFLIFVSSLADFVIGRFMQKSNKNSYRKRLLWLSLGLNLGLLGFFKYFNFFIDSFADTFSFLGVTFDETRLNILLPVGISFYTFQTLSYTIDIYRRKINACNDPVAFFAYVSFFPQLVAGPIERAKNLLPQFVDQRVFNYSKAADGVRQIIWGLFKKVVIADNCSLIVNSIFLNYQYEDSLTLCLGAFLFLFQVYCDFSGYSDIAIGLGRLCGFHLMKNFNFPFFSRDLPEFWKKWHISLTSWFVDYIYIPLGGSRNGLNTKVRNVLIIFLVSGLWHGANWTFIFWGALCGLAQVPYLLLGRNGRYVTYVAKGRYLPNFKELLQMSGVITFMSFSMIFFRSPDISVAWSYLIGILKFDFSLSVLDNYHFVLLIMGLLVWEWMFRSREHGLEIGHLTTKVRWSLYSVFIWLILFNFGSNQEYIYFQF